jgi:D-lactate dehydrogenase (cytochrome)
MTRHVGDANFHVLLPIMLDDVDLMGKVKAFVDRLVRRALRAEGTCTGEHGIGGGKMDYLVMEHGEGGVAVMRAIKDGLDPRNIMNPGKILYGKPRANAFVVDDAQTASAVTCDKRVAM